MTKLHTDAKIELAALLGIFKRYLVRQEFTPDGSSCFVVTTGLSSEFNLRLTFEVVSAAISPD